MKTEKKREVIKLENLKLVKMGRKPLQLPDPFKIDQKLIEQKLKFYEQKFNDDYIRERDLLAS